MSETSIPTQNNPQIAPESCLFDKGYTCPVCDEEFKARTVKHGKTKLVSMDADLKPYYTPVDPLHYEVILCPKCGYAAISSKFLKMTERAADRIRQEITPKFQPQNYPFVYDSQIGVERFKMALRNNEVKNGGSGEKGYIYLKMSWLYRELSDPEKELECMKQALSNFENAFQTERMPICGIEENMYLYILGELQRRLGNDDEALKYFGRVIVSNNVEPRLKERAFEQKEIIRIKRQAPTISEVNPEEVNLEKSKSDLKEKPKKLFKFFSF